jgi:hypothetical protein
MPAKLARSVRRMPSSRTKRKAQPWMIREGDIEREEVTEGMPLEAEPEPAGA